MKLVVDTNIVFSALLNTDNLIAQLLILPPPKIQFYSVAFLKEELDNHKERLKKLTGTNNLDELIHVTTANIVFIDDLLIPETYIQKAYHLVSDIDPGDTPFVALSINLKARLWTGDKKLLVGLERKKFKKVITTQQLQRLR